MSKGVAHPESIREEAWRLHTEEDMGKKKISAALNIPVATVYEWLSKRKAQSEEKKAETAERSKWLTRTLEGSPLTPELMHALYEVFHEELPEDMSQFKSVMPGLCRKVRKRMAWDPGGYQPKSREQFELYLWEELEEFPATMPRQTYEFTLGAPFSPVLEKFMGDRESFFPVIVGPLGSGKTIGSAQSVLARVQEQAPDAQGIRPSRVYCIRNTYPDLMGTTVKDFLEIWDGLGKFKGGGMERPAFNAFFELEDNTKVDAEVVFMALDNFKSVRHLRGIQASFGWFNEVKELPKAVVDMFLSRTGRFPSVSRVPCTWRGAIGDTNAPDEDDWLYKEFWDNVEANEGW